MVDKVYEIRDPITGEGISWGYEHGAFEGAGYDNYEEAQRAYLDSRTSSKAITSALKQVSGFRAGYRHNK